MKRIISIALCAIMLLSTAIFTANAATTRKVISTNPYFELVGEEVYIPANKVMKSTYNLTDPNYHYYIRLNEADNTDNEVEIKFTDCQTSTKYVSVSNKEYYTWCFDKTGGSRGGDTVNFNSGAYYQKVRIRMCDFDQEYFCYQYQGGQLVSEQHAYFLENGNYFSSDSTRDSDVIFDFTRVEGVEESGLIIICGAAMTAVKPDADGMVEFYIKKNLKNSIPNAEGKGTQYYSNSSYSLVFGGSLKMGMGNVDLDQIVNVKDATLIQKYCADMQTFNEVQKYFADTNNDGKINIMDSTEVQKYCSGLL